MALNHAVVCVPSLELACDYYVGLLQQRVVSRETVLRSEALAWLAPRVCGARSVLLQPPSGEPVYIRLIEQTTPAAYQPGTHYGWAALELTVADADAVHSVLTAASQPIIAPPKALSFTQNLYPMQARGPGGEALYLNEVRGNLPTSDLPVALCWVDRLFIAVLGCRDRARSLAFYQNVLGTTACDFYEIAYTTINLAFGLPLTQLHALCTVADGRNVLFELDQYPLAATSKPAAHGHLGAGVAAIGVRLPHAPVHAVRWLTPPACREHAPYFGATVGVLKGPDGELIELVW
jgi:catechol 2,3-dioxygenase-like lactoylglutathione lyase family enzyme